MTCVLDLMCVNARFKIVFTVLLLTIQVVPDKIKYYPRFWKAKISTLFWILKLIQFGQRLTPVVNNVLSQKNKAKGYLSNFDFCPKNPLCSWILWILLHKLFPKYLAHLSLFDKSRIKILQDSKQTKKKVSPPWTAQSTKWLVTVCLNFENL